MRTKPCDAQIMAGRRTKAAQFAEAARNVRMLADEADDVGDAFVTLAVHAGIAASDVICCARLGEHARTESHHDAVTLLERADHAAAKHLRTLLGMKTRAGYSHTAISHQDSLRAERAMDALVDLARRVR
ncbi:hypothetical protein ABE437_11535 [Isoptericola cucumis]|uniref:hypothetical protein n=1 Tax=Isoptericola cucumis TaxID=1776856 RepID=UPI00320B02F7